MYVHFSSKIQRSKCLSLNVENILLQVRRLLSLDCNDDPLWAQQLLEQLAPQLQEVQVNRFLTKKCFVENDPAFCLFKLLHLLQLWNVEKCHLECLQNMPQLRRLEVEGWSEALEGDPYKFPPLVPDIGGLHFLHVFLPKETSLSLIAAHGHSLKVCNVKLFIKMDFLPF